MKKNLLIILAVALVVICSCSWKHHSGKKLRPLPAANKEISVNYFNAVNIAGGVHVYYVQGTRNFVKFEGPESVLNKYGAEVKGEKLYVAIRDNDFDWSKDVDNVKIIVSSTDLIEAAIAGSGEFHADGHVDTDRLRLKVAGSGDIDMSDVICDNITSEIAGSGKIDVRQVTTGEALLNIAGSGNMNFNFLQCGSVKVKIAGSGDVKLKGKTHHSDWKVAGSGTVDTSELITN